MIGLCGAHRTGKTTLCDAYAAKHGWKSAKTSVSQIFRDMGHDPAAKFDFTTRLNIQEEILRRLNDFYRQNQGSSVITDRTPMDFLMYTMAEAIGDTVTAADEERFLRYINECFATTNRWFSAVIVVQPGIELKAEEGKAALNKSYIEHLNSLVIGLCCDERLKTPHFYIPRAHTELEERIKGIDAATSRVLERAIAQAATQEARQFH